MKKVVFMAFLAVQVFMVPHAIGEDCGGKIGVGENGIVVGGTFMVGLKGNEYPVISYIPSGTILKVLGSEKITKTEKDKDPKDECYYNVATTLGKEGFILQEETRSLSDFSGKYIFPRTEIIIYKRPSKEDVEKYSNDAIKNRHVFLSSVNPKQKKQLKVLKMSENEDFYEVTADFIGAKGYFPHAEIKNGSAALINTDRISFRKREIQFQGDGFLKLMRRLLPEQAFNEIENKTREITADLELSICKMPLSLSFKAGMAFDTWWIDAGIVGEGKIEIKPVNRTYRYEEHRVGETGPHRIIKISKSIVCDKDGMLWPQLVKVKFEDNKLEIRRDSFKKVKSLLRTEKNIMTNDSFTKLLEIHGYLDWVKVYQRLDEILQKRWAVFEDEYEVFLDLFIDSLSYYPPSEKRKRAPL